jgi:hypothetical protein
MEDLPDDVIISNIETFRNIIKQQKSYVDEMQLHLSNKDNVILGLQQTIKLLESTIECNQELIEKLRKEKESNVQHVYDITNELKILEQLEEKEKIISEMLITFIPREHHALEIKKLKEQYALDLESCKQQHVFDLDSCKQQCASELDSCKQQHALELESCKEQYASELESCKEQNKEKLFSSSSSIKDKIKKKYIKKELEIYKNENIALKNQIEFFKNMLMMNSMCKMYDFSYNYHPLYTPNQPPSYTPNQPPSYTPNQPPPSYNPHPSTPHRTNVKTEQITSNNNENQHKNKMGNVLEQLQQLQKQKQKDT